MNVPVNEDAELRELFRAEMMERAAALLAGARAFAAGEQTERLAHDLYREGHTVKGTARMMGFVAIAEAGALLQDTWRSIDEGAVAAPGLFDHLAEVAEHLQPAVDGDAEAGTPGLTEAVRRLRRLLRDGEEGGSEEPVAVAAPVHGAAVVSDGADLGGLLGTIDDWAFGENVRVNAASLFRFINAISALRVDAEALGESVAAVRGAVGDPAALSEQVEVLAVLAHDTEKAIGQLQEQAVALAAAPLSEITNTFPQLVRYLARKSDKEIRFELVGDHHRVDRQILERISEPLRLLLVNALHHGIEPKQARVQAGKPPTGTISLRFGVTDHRLNVLIEDDGRGIDWAAVERSALRQGLLEVGRQADRETLYALLFSPRFSTAPPDELIGEGDGLSTVSEAVESVHGTIRLESDPGRGTRVSLTVPTSRALQDAVLITAAGQMWGIPAIAVLARLPVGPDDLVETESGREIAWDGRRIPAIPFADAVGLAENDEPSRALVVSHPAGPVAFLVASEIGRRQVAAREVGPVLSGVPHLTGAALLGGGNVVVLVDPARLVEGARVVSAGGGAPRPRVLVVDDSQGARQVVGGALGSAGFEVELAAGATEALALVAEHSFDALVLDFVLPTMDGATLVRKIRQLGIESPIVMLSGLATPGDKARALEAGADGCLDKDDVRRGALSTALRDLLSSRGDGR